MANLLPPDIQARIQKHFRLRVSVVVLIMGGLAWLVALMFVLPTYILVEGKEKALLGLMDAYAPDAAKGENNPVLMVKNVREQIDQLETDGVLVSIPYEIIDGVLEHLTEDISLSRVAYSKGDDEGGELRINGVSSSRNSLQMYVEKLQQESIFSEIDDPYSNYIESEDLQFSLSIILNESHD